MIKRLSQCIREYKKDAILSPVYVLVESLLDVAIPFVMADLIDKGIDAGNMGMILRYGAILVGFALVALLFGALAGRSCARATAGFARNLRHDMFHHLQVYSFSNIDKFPCDNTKSAYEARHRQVYTSQSAVKVAEALGQLYAYCVGKPFK